METKTNGHADGNGGAKRSQDAFSLLVVIILAVAAYSSQRSLSGIDEKWADTSKKMDIMQSDINSMKTTMASEPLTREIKIETVRGALDSKIEKADNAINDRINAHEHRITNLEQRTQAADRRYEELRQMWQRK